MSASQLPCVLVCDNTDLATCTKSLWQSVLQFKHQIYVSSQHTWHVITIMVPPSYFLYKWNGTDSDHVSSAAIFQPHNVSSAAFCQLRCSVLTQRIADCQLGCKVSAHWQIVSSSVNSKLSLNAQLQFLGSIVICQLSLTLLWLCRSVHQIWPLHHHQQLKGGLISLSFARCYMPYRWPSADHYWRPQASWVMARCAMHWYTVAHPDHAEQKAAIKLSQDWDSSSSLDHGWLAIMVHNRWAWATHARTLCF